MELAGVPVVSGFLLVYLVYILVDLAIIAGGILLFVKGREHVRRRYAQPEQKNEPDTEMEKSDLRN